MTKAATSTATIVEPTGVPATIEISIPRRAHETDKTAEQVTTPRKLRNNRIDEIAGKMTRAEIRSEPTRFIAKTMITAVTTAISRLYAPAFVPVAREKSSSNVTENIL